MKVYVVETVLDELLQCGMTLSKEKADEMAKNLNERAKSRGYMSNEYWVEEYELGEDYTPFD